MSARLTFVRIEMAHSLLEDGESKPKSIKFHSRGTALVILLVLLAPLGSKYGFWNFGIGFILLTISAMGALFYFVYGLVRVFKHRKRQQRLLWPTSILITINFLVFGALGYQVNLAREAPPIHDISTDIIDPPMFDKLVPIRGIESNSTVFDSETANRLQVQHYPSVTTLAYPSIDLEEALNRVVLVLEDIGLDIVSVDESKLIVEATDTTFWFGFKDDVVVRIRKSGSGVIYDVRSLSRVGVSDLGTNARRITKILRQLQN